MTSEYVLPVLATIKSDTSCLQKHHEPLFNLALFTGMRPGELICVNQSNKHEGAKGLTWSQVDFKKWMIRLDSADTKTGEARNIPITDEIEEILRRIPRDIRCKHVFAFLGRPLSLT